MLWFDLLPQRRGKGEQAALVDVETPVLVAADDVEGEGRAVLGCVSVCDDKLQDAAGRFSLLGTRRKEM